MAAASLAVIIEERISEQCECLFFIHSLHLTFSQDSRLSPKLSAQPPCMVSCRTPIKYKSIFHHRHVADGRLHDHTSRPAVGVPMQSHIGVKVRQ